MSSPSFLRPCNTRPIIEIRGPISSEELTDLIRDCQLVSRLTVIALRFLQNLEDASDAVQDTLMELAKALNEGTRIANLLCFTAWWVCRKAVDIHRKNRRCLILSNDALSEMADRPRTPEPTIDMESVIAAVLERLKDKARIAFEIVVLNGGTRKEAARKCGCSPDYVSRLLGRARVIVRQIIDEKYAEII